MQQPLVFSRNFDTEIANEAAARASEGPKSYSEADLSRATEKTRIEAYAEGHAKGHADGLAEARGEIAAGTQASLEQLAPMLASFTAGIDAHRAAIEGQMVAYVLSLCETLFPRMVDHFGTDRMVEQITEIIVRLQGRATLTLWVAPDVADDVALPISQLTESNGERCAVTIRADDDLAIGDARLSWADGFAKISQATLTRAILTDLRSATTALTLDAQSSEKEQKP